MRAAAAALRVDVADIRGVATERQRDDGDRPRAADGAVDRVHGKTSCSISRSRGLLDVHALDEPVVDAVDVDDLRVVEDLSVERANDLTDGHS
jgi:hypothetical protein